MAQHTAHATQRTERAHWRTGAKWPRTPHTQHKAPSEHTGEQEPSGPGQSTHNTTHRAGTLVSRSHVAQDTVHAAQSNQSAHRLTGAKWPRTPCMRHNQPSRHSGEQEPGGPRQRTHNTTHGAGTLVNRSQVAKDTAHTERNAPSEHTGEQEPGGPGHRTRATQRTEQAHR